MPIGVVVVLVLSLSAPVKTETDNTNTTTTPIGTNPSAPKQTTPIQTTPTKTAPQTVTPPDAVTAKFKSMYPSVVGVKWMMGKQGNYAAMFKKNTSEARTVFSPDGNVIREATVLQKSNLPAGVTAYMDKNFAGKTPKRCEEIKGAKGKVIYVIRYDDKVVRLDANGVEVKPSEEMEETK